jgi:hypothetical protein
LSDWQHRPLEPLVQLLLQFDVLQGATQLVPMHSEFGEPQVVVVHPVWPALHVWSVELSVHCVWPAEQVAATQVPLAVLIWQSAAVVQVATA